MNQGLYHRFEKTSVSVFVGRVDVLPPCLEGKTKFFRMTSPWEHWVGKAGWQCHFGSSHPALFLPLFAHPPTPGGSEPERWRGKGSFLEIQLELKG